MKIKWGRLLWSVVLITSGAALGFVLARQMPVYIWEMDNAIMNNACEKLGTHHGLITDSTLTVVCGDATSRTFIRP